jgi:hypothetical protein
MFCRVADGMRQAVDSCANQGVALAKELEQRFQPLAAVGTGATDLLGATTSHPAAFGAAS